MPKPQILKVGLSISLYIFIYSHLLLDHRSQWMTSQTSQSKRLFNLVNPDHMRRAGTDHLLYQHTQEYTPLISTYTEPRSTTGAVVVTLRMVPGVTVSASGSLRGADLWTSTSPSQATTSSATASYQPMLPSATALTNTCSSGWTRHTEVSGVSGELPLFGVASATGPSPSTSDAYCA